MSDDERWDAVMGRKRDVGFVYAVRSTGIYCRPSCPSRRPQRRHVLFFDKPQTAARNGFRACRRCRPDTAVDADPAQDLVKRACAYIDNRLDGPPSLAELGAALGQSPFHVQRTFKRIVGISPRAYADTRRVARLKARLKGGDSIAGALYEVGYGSSSRLYERAGAQLGMTPGTYRKGGLGADIAYTIVPSPLGRLLVAATARGVAYVALGDRDGALLSALKQEYPAANLKRDDKALDAYVRPLNAYLAGRHVAPDLPVDVRATAFQRKVWEALRAIPAGETRSYKDIARAIGAPRAVRAVGSACAANPVALIVPCHRAIRQDGALGGYAWGLKRKEKLLASEQRRAQGRR
ncbi:MAG: bifunctional DNA-binding transcriptional regulator/O6-methylguanine-DNA methyltransferase Ada [Alphaproteobacteria bacterium]